MALFDWRRPKHLRGLSKDEVKTIQNRAEHLTDEVIQLHQQVNLQKKQNNYEDMWRALQDATDFTVSKTPDSFIKNGFMRNTIAYRAVDTIAQAVASMEFCLYNKQSGKEITNQNHPVVKLLNHPNNRQSLYDFLYLAEAYKQVTGGAYIWMNKGPTSGINNRQPKSLEVLESQNIKTKNGDDLFLPRSYCYKRPNMNTYKEFPVNQVTGQSDIIEVKYQNLLDPRGTFSPMSVAIEVISRHNESNIWNLGLLKNGGRIGQIFQFKQDLSREQRDMIREEIEKTIVGAQNAGKPSIINGDYDIHDTQVQPKDMDYADSQKDAAIQIAGVFKIPPQLVGITDASTYNNVSEAKKELYYQVVIPEAEYICDQLNRWLLPLYNQNLCLKLNLDNVEALSPDRYKKWEMVSKAPFLTDNEKREAFGYEPLEDEGNTLKKPSQRYLVEEESAAEKSVDELVEEIKDDNRETKTLVGQETNKVNGHAHTLLEGDVTSEDQDHSHTWKDGDVFTSTDLNHYHEIPTPKSDNPGEDNTSEWENNDL